MNLKKMETKICLKCEISRTIQSFRLDRKICKICDNEMDKLRKKRARQKKQEMLVQCNQCHLEKPRKAFAKLKKYYKTPICLSCYPLFLSEQKRKWCQNEHATNLNYRIKKSLASRLRNVLEKNQTTMSYIGCNIQYLREWFEFNFTDEMNWSNYGTFWSIDHVIPVNLFDLTNENEKLKCWHWSNLMPVSVKYNSSKKEIDQEQVHFIISQLFRFKEEGSTTKWFSEEFMLNELLLQEKLNSF
jgi:hypothetical protein